MLYGKISFVDVSNALKILLYYKEFQQIVFLDDQLSQNGDIISLENLGFEQTDLVCSSFNNSFWIFNKQNNELIRFDENSQPIAKTGNLSQVLKAGIKPNFMIEHNSFLYLNCPDIGIYIFDFYGTLSKMIGIKNVMELQVSNNRIFYFKNHKLCAFDTKLMDEECQPYQDSLIQTIRVGKERLYVAYDDSLKVFANTPK
jgi:hypothetical protein